jgi:hypothetical protein
MKLYWIDFHIMNKIIYKLGTSGIAIVSLLLMIPHPLQAAMVSPAGVNVNTFGTTTVFLTLLNLSNQVPAEALWCGAVNANGSCVPGTIFGRLPRRYNRGFISGIGNSNYTDIMTIPASITRKAYQDALRGNQSDFFYVRRLISTTGGIDEFVTVTCRLTSSGAGVPLSITSIQYQLADRQPAPPIGIGSALPRFGANISYNGTGRLKGRWEVVLPGDSAPRQLDLLTEATLPLEQRGLQRRYTELERFDLFLQPNGKVFLPGPDPATLPKGSKGLHQILLRIEATDNAAGISFNNISNVPTGGVAGFPLPIFRYSITAQPDRIVLLQPNPSGQLFTGKQLRFSWQGVDTAVAYKLELKQSNRLVFSSLIAGNKTSYTAPPWINKIQGANLTWQIKALKADGSLLTESEARSLQLQVGR